MISRHVLKYLNGFYVVIHKSYRLTEGGVTIFKIDANEILTYRLQQSIKTS